MKLFTPGPVNISEAAAHAAAEPMIHHRTPEFAAVMRDLKRNLKTVFQTQHEVLTLASSGTGAMEAVVVNLFSPGDRALIPVGGKFSRRWSEICEAYAIGQLRMDLEAGAVPSPSAVVDALQTNSDIGAVLLTHCETSTGGLSDLEAISRAVRRMGREDGRHVLLCADCITSLCVDELRMDEWGIDCAVAASQKGLLCPPGLAFVALSDEAVRLVRKPGLSRYYLDLGRYLDEEAGCPFTPAVPLVRAAATSLARIDEIGLEKVWRANRSAARVVSHLVVEAGFEPLGDRMGSAVVAFWTGDVDADKIVSILAARHDIVIAHGQGNLKGEILRISAIGKAPGELREFAAAFAATMAELDRPVDLDRLKHTIEPLMEDCAIWE